MENSSVLKLFHFPVLATFLLCLPGTAPLGCASDAGTDSFSTAEALTQAGKFSEALPVLDNLCQKPSAPAEAQYLRGYVLYRMGRLEAARQQLEKIVASPPQATRSRYFLGRIALSEGHPEKAIEWLRPLGDLQPPVEDTPAELGKAYLAARQLKEAQRWTQKAIDISPWDGGLRYRLARIYQQMGESGLSTAEFKKSKELKGEDREAVRKLLECSEALAAHRRDDALAIRDSLLSQDNLDPDVLVSVGSSLAGAGLPADAVPAFEAAVHRDPTQFQAQFDLGLAYAKLGRPNEAVGPLAESLKILPNSVEANAALGLSYVLLKQFDKALAPLERLHRQKAGNGQTEGLLALVYLRMHQAQKATPIVKSALAHNPNDSKLYFVLIECLNASEDQSGALKIANAAAEKFPQLAKAHLAKGQQLARLGKYQEARLSFETAAELAPGDPEPLLGLAEAQNKAGQYEDSLATYRRILQADSANLTAGLGASRNLISMGRLSEARDLLEKTSSSHKDSSQVHIELARVYARMGERDRAAEQTRISQQLREAEEKQAASQ